MMVRFSMLAKIWNHPKVRRDSVLILSIGTLLAIMSPFEATSHLPFVWAWSYWTGLLLWGWSASFFVGPFLLRSLPDLPTPVFYLLVSMMMALVVFPAILAVQALVGYQIPLSYWPQLLFLVWVISAAITGVNFLSERAFAPKPKADGSAFMTRIPAKIAGGTLLAISSEDHYLRIQTSRGSDLILMRLADAMSELDGFDGMQVHRSWWVARQGVQKVKRDQGRIFLILRDDTQVPVSRTYAPKIRQAGWLG
jgi:hypothetical protein